MHIVIVGPASPWRGGIAHFNDLLARQLAVDHHVEVLTFTRQYPEWLFPGKNQKHPGEASLDVNAQPILDSINPWSWHQTANRIKELRPDLLVLRYWMPFFAPALGTVVRRARGSFGESLMIADNVVPHERRILDTPLTRYALAPIDRFVTLSSSVRDDLLAFRPNAKVTVSPHPLYDQFGDGVPMAEARVKLGIDRDRPVLLFFGFVRGYKGLDVLLEAMPAVRERVPNVQLLVVGEFYDSPDPYHAQVEKHDLQNHVRFVNDYVANDQVAPWFSAANVVVLPYRHATQSGIVPVAYHLERPVICSHVGGLGEIVLHEKCGFLVEPNDPAALATAVARFFLEGWESKLVEGVRAEKPKYSWAHFADVVTNRGS